MDLPFSMLFSRQVVSHIHVSRWNHLAFFRFQASGCSSIMPFLRWISSVPRRTFGLWFLLWWKVRAFEWVPSFSSCVEYCQRDSIFSCPSRKLCYRIVLCDKGVGTHWKNSSQDPLRVSSKQILTTASSSLSGSPAMSSLLDHSNWPTSILKS